MSSNPFHPTNHVPGCLVHSLVVAILFVTALLSGAAAVPADPRIVIPNNRVDQDNNRRHDDLDRRLKTISVRAASDHLAEQLDLILALSSPPTPEEDQLAQRFGGRVLAQWTHAFYGLHLQLPVSEIDHFLAAHDHWVWIEENQPIMEWLEHSTSQIRARQVWAGWKPLPPGYCGNPAHRIAIVDSGFDDSHPDLPAVAGSAGGWPLWVDFVASNPAPAIGYDVRQHGTFVAGIALGRGTAAGLEDYTLTDASHFLAFPGFGLTTLFPIHCRGNKMLSGRLSWSGGGSASLEFWNGDYTALLGAGSGTSPLTVQAPVSAIDGNDYLAWFAANDFPPAGNTASLQIQVPYDAIGDGFNLLSGLAPACGAVALRVINDSGMGEDADFFSALDYLVAHAADQSIVVANISLGSPGERSPVVETAMNNVVNGGCALVVAAGNTQGIEEIGPLGYAMKSITVGAVNRSDQLTAYSSLGKEAETDIKPDVTAPGGSDSSFDSADFGLITSVDSNDADIAMDLNNFLDETVTADVEPNDYQAQQGTSAAAPHVAGLVALLAGAMGQPGTPFPVWNWKSDASPLLAKMVICATAVEHPMAESLYFPTLDRGTQDRSEGFGRINADAAVEALTLAQPVDVVSAPFNLGENSTDKQVWARYVQLEPATRYRFGVDLLAGTADVDLYLYRGQPSPIGLPVIAASTVTDLVSNESITVDSRVLGAGVYLLVAKWVAGNATLQGVAERYDIPAVVWTDFNYIGTELGTQFKPVNTLVEGLALVQPGGTIKIKPGTTNSPARITQSVKLEAPQGKVRLGAAK